MKTPIEGRLLSIQAGRAQRMLMPENSRIDAQDRFWTSGIYKNGVAGPVRATAAGIEGDEQADLFNHGGPDNVVLAYDAAHYPEWRRVLEMPELAYGGFGENFTVSGFSDEDVCIGDVWDVGDEGGLLLQVTQARQPCFKLARRLGTPDVVKIVREKSRGGWYLRVLREGLAEAGMAIRLAERSHPEWTVAAAVQVMYARRKEPEQARLLAALPELSARWKQELLEE